MHLRKRDTTTANKRHSPTRSRGGAQLESVRSSSKFDCQPVPTCGKCPASSPREGFDSCHWREGRVEPYLICTPAPLDVEPHSPRLRPLLPPPGILATTIRYSGRFPCSTWEFACAQYPQDVTILYCRTSVISVSGVRAVHIATTWPSTTPTLHRPGFLSWQTTGGLNMAANSNGTLSPDEPLARIAEQQLIVRPCVHPSTLATAED